MIVQTALQSYLQFEFMHQCVAVRADLLKEGEEEEVGNQVLTVLLFPWLLLSPEALPACT